MRIRSVRGTLTPALSRGERELRVLGQHLFGVFAGGVGNFFAAGHAGDFFDTLAETERLDVSRGVIGLHRLGDTVVLVAVAGDLRQMRDAEHLVRARNVAQLFAHDLGRYPTYTDIHFVKD